MVVLVRSSEGQATFTLFTERTLKITTNRPFVIGRSMNFESQNDSRQEDKKTCYDGQCTFTNLLRNILSGLLELSGLFGATLLCHNV